MKRSLLFSFTAVLSLLLCLNNPVKGQTVVFSENFSGFSGNSHTTPSTSDASSNLDSKTQMPGWTGYKIYSAGGEIKVGTADITGWIETPQISFSGFEGNLILKFDICRYSNDATSVRVLLNSEQIGNNLSPSADFQTIEIPVTPGVPSGKIKFEAVSKRFFLDNISVVAQNSSTSVHSYDEPCPVRIFPNPAGDFVTVICGPEYEILEVCDISGRICKTMILTRTDRTEICLSDLPAGIYFIRLSFGRKLFTGRLIKLQ
jgi:hypothetical protein